MHQFKPGDWVIYRKQKISASPGRRAQHTNPSPKGETYTYVVDKYWVVDEVGEDLAGLGKRVTMIAPTGLYDSFSVITPAEAADMICDAIRTRPKRVSTPLGVVAQIGASVAPQFFDVGLHLAYRLFPDSAAARGDVPVDDERPSGLGRVFARLLPGVHW